MIGHCWTDIHNPICADHYTEVLHDGTYGNALFGRGELAVAIDPKLKASMNKPIEDLTKECEGEIDYRPLQKESDSDEHSLETFESG